MARVLERPAAPARRDAIRVHRPGLSSQTFVAASALAEFVAAGVLFYVAASSPSRFSAGVVAFVFIALRAALGAARGRVTGAIAWGGIAAMPFVMLLPASNRPDSALAASLCGLALLACGCATTASIATPAVLDGERQGTLAALVWSALAGAGGVLLTLWLAEVLPLHDGRLGSLSAYVAAAGAVAGVAELLAHQRVVRGFASTAFVLIFGGIAIEVLVLATTHASTVDDAVQAYVLGTGAAAVGLVVATATSSPRPLTVPADQAVDEPRAVGLLVAAVLVVALAVRLVAMRPVWVDEAALSTTTGGSLRSVLSAARTADAHPPLFELVSWVSRHLFGASDWALRLPSLVAGILLVGVVYVTAGELYDRRAAVIAAVVVAVGPGMVWLSDIGSPASLAALLSTITLLTMVRAMRRPEFAQWILFGVSCAALVWTHQFGLLHVVVLNVAIALSVFRARRDEEPTTALIRGWSVALGLTAAATAAVLVYRGGFGRPDVLPPLEYATNGAPGAGRSVFGIAGTALTALVGFHPEDVTSRLLALWPLCILGTFVLFGRRWSQTGLLLLATAIAPFAALLVLQAAGAPRTPPFALEWVATAVPMLAIGIGRGLSLLGGWRAMRPVAAVFAVLLLIASIDQIARVQPTDRFDVASIIDRVGADARPGDVIVTTPPIIDDLVARKAEGVQLAPVANASAESLRSATRVFVIGAFGFDNDQSVPATLALVTQLSAQRHLVEEIGQPEAKAWSFQ